MHIVKETNIQIDRNWWIDERFKKSHVNYLKSKEIEESNQRIDRTPSSNRNVSFSSSSTTHSLQPINPVTNQFFSDTDILDSSSNSPSAPDDPNYQQINSEQNNLNTQNVNPTTLQNQTFLDTNSDISFIETERPPLPEIPITPTPVYHIPEPESVIPFITRSPHRPSTAIKTSRLQIIPQEQKTPLPELEPTSSSTLYPKLKLKKTSISSSLSSLNK